MGARGVSLDHVKNMENTEKMENMEMFSTSPTEVFSGSPTEMFSGSPIEMFSGSRIINQRSTGKWHMYHTDETRFYQPDDSKVTRRLLKEKNKLTFV